MLHCIPQRLLLSWQFWCVEEAAGTASHGQQHLCCRLVCCTHALHWSASKPAWLTCTSDVINAHTHPHIHTPCIAWLLDGEVKIQTSNNLKLLYDENHNCSLFYCVCNTNIYKFESKVFKKLNVLIKLCFFSWNRSVYWLLSFDQDWNNRTIIWWLWWMNATEWIHWLFLLRHLEDNSLVCYWNSSTTIEWSFMKLGGDILGLKDDQKCYPMVVKSLLI